MKDKMKKQAKTTQTVVTNIAEFADASCLAAVSGFAIYSGLQHTGFWYRALLLAGVVIALQAAHLYLRHFSKQAKK